MTTTTTRPGPARTEKLVDQCLEILCKEMKSLIFFIEERLHAFFSDYRIGVPWTIQVKVLFIVLMGASVLITGCAGSTQVIQQVGMHIGFALSGNTSSLGGFEPPNGGYVLGAQYLMDSGFSIGIQVDGVVDEPVFTVGLDDPLWFITMFEMLLDWD